MDALRALTDALSTPLFEQVDDLARDTDTHVGWGALLDVDACPAYALPWLAQLVGVTLPDGLSEAQQRTRIKDEAGFDRGTLAALLAAARRTLTGTKTVYFRERDTSPYHLTMIALTGEAPDQAQVLKDVLEVKPAGIVLTLSFVAGSTYLVIRTNRATYTAVKAAYATYTALRTGP